MATTSSPSTDRVSWHGIEMAKLPEVAPWVERLGRAGYFAKGVVYFIIGLLAFKLAIGAGGETSGSKGAIEEIGQQPFGKFMLGLVAIGLLGYTAWRWVQMIKDTEGNGTDAKGIIKRIAYGISGAAYLVLGCFAGSRSLGFGGQSQSGGSSSGASFLLDSTWGRVVLGIAGALTIGVGVYFAYKGYVAKFMAKYDLAAMGEKVRQFAYYAGRIGLITRGVAFAIVGWFLIQSAMNGTSDGEIAGMSDALAAIAAQSFGKILIGITGFGLMCYGVHGAVMGYYRRFNVR